MLFELVKRWKDKKEEITGNIKAFCSFVHQLPRRLLVRVGREDVYISPCFYSLYYEFVRSNQAWTCQGVHGISSNYGQTSQYYPGRSKLLSTRNPVGRTWEPSGDGTSFCLVADKDVDA